jgi:NAD kinase
MDNEKIVFFPIYPEPGSQGSERSNDVREWIERFLLSAGIATLDESKANAYLVATGDGGLMRAAREKHSQRKVIVGVNRGRFGFLLNPIDKITQLPKLMSELKFVTLSLIQVTFVDKDGQSHGPFLAFNDVLFGADIADFIEFKISGTLNHFPNRTVEGSGVVVSTPQGTTAFALKARGTAALLPLDTQHWFICGIATGPYPCDQVSPQKITIEVSSRLPINGYADGYANKITDIASAIIEPTDKTVTLGFINDLDFAARRTQLAQKAERGE